MGHNFGKLPHQATFKTGRNNTDEDALSRIPWNCALNSETVKAVKNIIQPDEVVTFEVYVGSSVQSHQVEVKTHPTN